MKYPFLIFCFVLWGTIAAQGVVEIIAEPSIEKAEQGRIWRAKTAKVKGYRVMIGFYNSRANATLEMNRVTSLFGADYSTKLAYDEPNWKVYAGEFYTKGEADAALLKIRRRYPSARIITELLPPKTEQE